MIVVFPPSLYTIVGYTKCIILIVKILWCPDHNQLWPLLAVMATTLAGGTWFTYEYSRHTPDVR